MQRSFNCEQIKNQEFCIQPSRTFDCCKWSDSTKQDRYGCIDGACKKVGYGFSGETYESSNCDGKLCGVNSDK